MCGFRNELRESASWELNVIVMGDNLFKGLIRFGSDFIWPGNSIRCGAFHFSPSRVVRGLHSCSLFFGFSSRLSRPLLASRGNCSFLRSRCSLQTFLNLLANWFILYGPSIGIRFSTRLDGAKRRLILIWCTISNFVQLSKINECVTSHYTLKHYSKQTTTIKNYNQHSF